MHLKILSIFAAFVFFLPQVNAQYNTSLLYSTNFSSSATKLPPSMMGNNVQFLEVNLAHSYVWVGNNNLTYEKVKEFVNEDYYSDDEINATLAEMEDKNLVGFGTNVTPLEAIVKIGGADNELFTIGVGMNVRYGFTMTYGKTFMDLLWNGNEKFAGDTIGLGPFGLNAYLNKEYAVGASLPLELPFAEGLVIRPGLRIKYIQSAMSVYTEEGKLALFTPEGGDSLYFLSDYNIHTAVPRDGFDFNDVFDNLGTGFGVDLGVTATYKDNFQVSLSFLDLGAVKYNRSVKSYSKHDNYAFNGIGIDLVNTIEQEDIALEPDTFEVILNPDINNKDYSMPLGAKLFLQGEYRFGRSITSTKNEREFFRSHIFFTYIQGFNDLPFTTDRPFVSIGYSHDFGGIFNLGGTASYGGYNGFAMGGFSSLRFGPFKFGIGSANLMTLIAPRLGTGAEVTVNTSLSF